MLPKLSKESRLTFDFDAMSWDLVPARSFDQLRVGEIFRAPSRTLPSAHASVSEKVSRDKHPSHYDVELAHRFGHQSPVVHGLQSRVFSAQAAAVGAL